MNSVFLAISAAALMTTSAIADTFVESFTGGSNTGSWTYYAPDEVIESAGGNPGAFLHAWNMDTFAPRPQTAWGVQSIFTGDYRARNVTSLGIDLILFHVDFSADERPLSLILVHDNFTPGDFSDDYGAYFLGPEDVPLVGEGWKSFDFDVPSQSSTLPAGWRFIVFGENAPADPQWVDVVSHVSQVMFFYGNPEDFFIFQMWDVGMDNPRITEDQGAAIIRGFSFAFGSHVSGGIGELEESDNAWLRTRSQFGFLATEANVMDLRVTFETADVSAQTMDVTIEARLNHAGGTARTRLRNWSSGNFVEIDQYPIGLSETVRLVEDVPAPAYIRQSDGRIILSVKHTVVTTFTPMGFDSFIDQTAIATGQ